MDKSKQEKIDLLYYICRYSDNDEYLEKLYSNITGSSVYDNKDIVSYNDLKSYLYDEFNEYYSIIINEENDQKYIGGNKNKLWLINMCKIQLDKELHKLKNR